MKVLMFGWEFPPHFSGGLGVVCYELTKAMTSMGVQTTYVMPFGPKGMDADYVNLVIASNLLSNPNIKIEAVPSLLTPYVTSEGYEVEYSKSLGKLEGTSTKVYSPTLFEEVHRFAHIAAQLGQSYEYDVIHAHDWLTFPAAMKVKAVTGKPLIVHIHATEFDRTGDGGVNQFVYDIERAGMHAADVVVAVSQKIKNRCVHQYGVPEEKVRVIYNAVNLSAPVPLEKYHIKEKDKVVLFLGRVTLQKGPDYFIEAAKKVIDKDPNVKFIMAGSGDMLPRMIRRAAELGIGDKVIFPGFVSRPDADRLYRMADVFVMPSVSEPFGLVPLEAMVQETPVIISKQSGVSEVLNHCIKVDFWDVDAMAQKILALLHYGQLNNTMKQHGSIEVQKFDWAKPAEQVNNLYKEVLSR